MKPSEEAIGIPRIEEESPCSKSKSPSAVSKKHEKKKKQKKRKKLMTDEETSSSDAKRVRRDDDELLVETKNANEEESGRPDKKRKKKKKKDKKKRKAKRDAKECRENGSKQDSSHHHVVDEASTGCTEKKQKEETKTKQMLTDIHVDDDKIVQSSALDFLPNIAAKVLPNGDSTTTTTTTTTMERNVADVTLLLFYQYVEPPWDTEFYNHTVLKYMQRLGTDLALTGRMRVAKEGLNCTLTGTNDNILRYCQSLRTFHKGEFAQTEFKLTKDLPHGQMFPSLKIIPVTELVHYGLAGDRAPPIAYTGVHLEPQLYHEKLAQENTVVIDVRNHYEATIGRFQPPQEGAKWLDPKMRKSTEFPVWLDKEETKQELRGKQVLMYCTGGVRCERASALLKYKMETDPEIKDLDIKGVYQLQGGIDKYFKNFPDGGFWEGKNYVFDKRFAHAPPKQEADNAKATKEKHDNKNKKIMGKCQVCAKPWDMFRGKRRCPTCGVPSLICRDCFQADRDGIRKIDRSIRCDLCVQENITSKSQLREREQKELQEYEAKLYEAGGADSSKMDTLNSTKQAPNPHGVTRLLLKNMCRKNMDEAKLMKTLPGITHIVWRTDRKTGQFFGSGWVEMATPDDASRAVAMNGKRVLGRPLYIEYQPPDGKDAWPPPSSAVGLTTDLSF